MELKAAEERFYARERDFFTSEGAPKYSPEEHVRRFHGLVEQFDITVRKLLDRTDRDIQAQQQLLDAPPGKRPEGKELQRARRRLEAAQRLKRGAKKVRAIVVNEKTEEKDPDPRRPQGPPLLR